MRIIKLTRGGETLVSDKDYDRVNEHRWCLGFFGPKENLRPTAYRGKRVNGKRTVIYLSRWICNAPADKQVDHANRNTLDNQRENLRICTAQENCRNRGVRRGKKTSQFKGVYYRPRWARRWICDIDGKERSRHFTELEAAEAYNEWAKKLHGAFARLNVLPQTKRPESPEGDSSPTAPGETGV